MKNTPFKDPKRKKEHNKKYREIHKEELKIKAKKRYLKTKDKWKIYRKQHHLSMRRKVITKLGGKCVYCGCDILDALEINHVNGGGHKEYHTKGTYHILKEIIEGIYPHPVELTCKVCNAVHCLKMKGITGFKVIYNAD